MATKTHQWSNRRDGQPVAADGQTCERAHGQHLEPDHHQHQPGESGSEA